jgi:hypothetical protein
METIHRSTRLASQDHPGDSGRLWHNGHHAAVWHVQAGALALGRKDVLE